jgi:hypothetical protein
MSSVNELPLHEEVQQFTPSLTTPIVTGIPRVGKYSSSDASTGERMEREAIQK